MLRTTGFAFASLLLFACSLTQGQEHSIQRKPTIADRIRAEVRAIAPGDDAAADESTPKRSPAQRLRDAVKGAPIDSNKNSTVNPTRLRSSAPPSRSTIQPTSVFSWPPCKTAAGWRSSNRIRRSSCDAWKTAIGHTWWWPSARTPVGSPEFARRSRAHRRVERRDRPAFALAADRRGTDREARISRRKQPAQSHRRVSC